jgi:hypothetical protein
MLLRGLQHQGVGSQWPVGCAQTSEGPWYHTGVRNFHGISNIVMPLREDRVEEKDPLGVAAAQGASGQFFGAITHLCCGRSVAVIVAPLCDSGMRHPGRRPVRMGRVGAQMSTRATRAKTPRQANALMNVRRDVQAAPRPVPRPVRGLKLSRSAPAAHAAATSAGAASTRLSRAVRDFRGRR